MSATCRSCKRPIRWTTTTNDKRLPLDPDPTPDGNVRLIAVVGAAGLRADVLNRDDALVARGEGADLYRAHFKTCPQAHLHRRASR